MTRVLTHTVLIGGPRDGEIHLVWQGQGKLAFPPPVGRPGRNMDVYILDELVPAPGLDISGRFLYEGRFSYEEATKFPLFAY